MCENQEIQEQSAFIEEESWLRQRRETGAAFFAFCLYRDYGGDRSIRKVLERAELPQQRSSIWRAWSQKYRWQRRCADYDNHLDAIRRQEREEAFRQRERKHLEISDKMLTLVEQRLEKLDPEELSQGTITDWVKSCVSLERENYQEEGNTNKGKLKQLEISFFEEFDGI